MQRRQFITLLGGATAASFSANAQQANPMSHTIINEAMRRAVERKDCAGVVVMAANRKGVLYEGAFGVADIGESRPLKLDSLFRIASMTKAISSAAALQLVEQGRFSVDDFVDKYLPEFANLQMLFEYPRMRGDVVARFTCFVFDPLKSPRVTHTAIICDHVVIIGDRAAIPRFLRGRRPRIEEEHHHREHHEHG